MVDDRNAFSNKSFMFPPSAFQKDCQSCLSVLEFNNMEKEPMTTPLKIQGDNLEP